MIVRERPNLRTSLNINVVFHLPGSILTPEFVGARTGSYRKADDALMVQVALPWEPPEHMNEYLRGKLELALDETDPWITRRKKSQYDLSALREFVRTLPLEDPPARL
ncbi:hypothetical protein B7R22_16640 [Subtercola boreus]|uniref:Uncharacterized protein n=1 Tax=Subtercola boreus TaxID=120213 RepID=A0A3E0VRK4_9MICO|nr:hypothetical protein [Subtercola boreus]RFA12255.1 hypothetical protein B7R22_16640 [Subtercola boreus]